MSECYSYFNTDPRILVGQYIEFYLLKEGMVWREAPVFPEPTPATELIQKLCYSYARLSKSVMDRIFDQQIEYTEENEREYFRGFMDDILKMDSKKWSWETMVLVISLVGQLSARVYREKKMKLIPRIVNFFAEYYEERLENWIVDNGGWEIGFVQYYSGRIESLKKIQKNESVKCDKIIQKVITCAVCVGFLIIVYVMRK